jgi:hypothetical protein
MSLLLELSDGTTVWVTATRPLTADTYSELHAYLMVWEAVLKKRAAAELADAEHELAAQGKGTP